MTLRLDLTKNLKYDRLTKKIIEQNLASDDVAIDIGCHKGEILDLFLKSAPQQKHYGFEPIPALYLELKSKYNSRAHIFDCALSNISGKTTFQLVKDDLAYSGLKQREYTTENPQIEKIEVDVKRLDDVLNSETKIALVKIDVEGGELNVLKGGLELLKSNKPLIVFECGLGASDYYGTSPEEVHSFLSNLDYQLFTLSAFTKNLNALDLRQFCALYNTKEEYYFVAKC